MKRTSEKVQRPTHYQTAVLKMIARSRLIKTRVADNPVPVWVIDGLGSITHECAQTLIRNGWVTPQRDGLPMFEETQSYKALTP